MTREEIEKRMDELARQYADAHDELPSSSIVLESTRHHEGAVYLIPVVGLSEDFEL